jgi:dipeptidyl aminopeptidase/acylaminoacyl peptidase
MGLCGSAVLLAAALGEGCAPVKIEPAGYIIEEKTMAVASDRTLRYTLALPPAFSPDRRYPLVVALHYGGPVTPYYGKPFLVNLILPGLGGLEALMVAPDCPSETWTEPRSEEAVLTLIRRVAEDYPVDPRRIVLTGFSLGAIGTWKLALEHPDMFSATIPISGMPPRGVVVGPAAPPFLVIHSLSDEIFPLGPLREFLTFCGERGLEVEFRPVPGLSHYGYDAFVPALREAVPWLEEIWGKKKSSA